MTQETSTDSDALAEAVFASVRQYVSDEIARAVAPLLEQIEAIPAGPQGERGADGAAGSDGTAGVDGKDGSPGADGQAGEKGEPGPAGDAGPAGEPGRDGAQGPAGQDGAPGMDGMPGAPGQDGREGRDGRDGEPGKDALELEVLDSIDERKSYRRGTYATHKGGLWRAADTTDGMDGWVCITRGVDREEETVEDSGRVIKRRTIYSDGQVFEREIKTAAMVYRGLFAEERAYDVGDMATWAGSVWHCETPTSDRPGEGSKSWRLAVKRGRDFRLKD